MTAKSLHSLCLLMGLLLISTGTVMGEDLDYFSKASCDFAVNLLKTQSKLSEGNVLLSPSSVGVLMAILQQGAGENTLKQLDNMLQMTPEQSRNGHSRAISRLLGEKKNVTLEWGNRAYIRPGFEFDDNFNKTISESFGAAIEELNFAEPSPQEAANKINNWVKEVTHDNIQNLITPSLLSESTVMVLLNAIYFKGLWDVPFDKRFTLEDNFELAPENAVKVSMMSQVESFIAGEDSELGVQWVNLPFKDEMFSMLFILPIEKHGLSNVLENMTGEILKKIMNNDEVKKVILKLPKFKLSEKFVLSGALQQLGVTDIFTSNSNFRGIATNFENLRVSTVIHQAGVEIDESGTTASAATAVIFKLTSAPLNSPFHFNADHPFLFFILDKANNIPLFAGKVVNPVHI